MNAKIACVGLMVVASLGSVARPGRAEPASGGRERAAEPKRQADAGRLAAQAAAAYEAGDFEAAAALYVRAVEAGAASPSVPYNAACSFARTGKTDDAFTYLDHAIDKGWRDPDHLQRDPDLASLRSDPRWDDLIRRCEAKRETFRKSLGNPELYDELLRRMKIDQEARLSSSPDIEEMMRIDADNTRWMKQVVEEHGWPGRSMVGPDGAQAAWLLVQHADADRAFQRQCLELLRAAYERGDVPGTHVAYLADRVRVGEGKPQLYGTQFQTVDGTTRPFPIENEAEVDQRRARMGLGPLAEYAARMRSLNSSP